ncbi:MAG: hypothetical protein Fur0022_39730 [Anaerolineales bacterium]
MTLSLKVTPWPHAHSPTEAELRQLLAAEGLAPYTWGNSPHDLYAAHSHSYHKVIYVVRGRITFGLPQERREITLFAGDRLDLPARVVHNATVGAEGVLCLEAHRRM